VWDFFWTFSRFEYALKQSGYCCARDGAAQADWESFQNDLAKLDPAELDRVLACGQYIAKTPPKKQVLQGTGLAWADSTPTEPAIKTLLIYVRRVRNNLFHGGKMSEGSERDSTLIRESLAVLRAVLTLPKLPQGINDAFG